MSSIHPVVNAIANSRTPISHDWSGNCHNYWCNNCVSPACSERVKKDLFIAPPGRKCAYVASQPKKYHSLSCIFDESNHASYHLEVCRII